MNARQVDTMPVHGGKRKELSAPTGPDALPPQPKRAKASQGLPSNWEGIVKQREALAMSAKPSRSSSISSRQTGYVSSASEPDFTGEFDGDIALDALVASRESKMNRSTLRGVKVLGMVTSTASMGIKLEHVSNDNLPHTSHPRREPGQRHYHLSDLPFPPGTGTANLKRWSKEYMPCLIDWATSLEDPFASNSHEDIATVVKSNWDQIWPELADRHDHPAILAAVSSGLRDWRSVIGKTALKAVQELWEEGTPASEIKEIVAQYFPVPRHIFVRPDAESDRGPFQSTLILKVFALQQSLTIKIPVTYGNPIGGLALCAAAVERALELWKEGTNTSLEANAGTGKKVRRSRGYEFGNEKWGKATKNYAKTTAALKDHHWDAICHGALDFTDESTTKEMQDLAAQRGLPEALDPRAAINLDDD